MKEYRVIAKKLLNLSNGKNMELVALQRPDDLGKLSNELPVIAVNNSKVDLKGDKTYNCSVYFNKGKFNNLYKVEE